MDYAMTEIVDIERNLGGVKEKFGDKPIVIYGMSKRAIYTYGTLEMLGNNITAFTDSNQIKETERQFCGKEIWSLEKVKENAANINVVVATQHPRFKREICESLVGMGVVEKRIFIYGVLDSEKWRDEKGQLLQNANKLQIVYDNLADEESRIIYKEILEYRKTEELKLIQDAAKRSFAKGSQYFDCDIVKLTADEVFVDGGAWIGDTVDAFVSNAKEGFEYIYSFEANPAIHSVLKEMFSALKISDKAEIVPYAMSDEEKDVFFDVGEAGECTTGGKISEKGLRVQAVPIDDILKDKRVTYIKMDIEGAEMEALKGARHIIELQRPKLAICIYHSIDDLYEIPIYLMQICKGYKFYVRHYSNKWIESVLYAIPEENC